MTSKTWRQRWLEPLTRLLRGDALPHRCAAGRNRVVPRLEFLEPRLSPATTFSIADNSVIEPSPGGTVNLDFTVTRTGDTTSQVTVGYTTVAGTATAKPPGTDFTPITGTVLFPTGVATETIR
jgi:Calx-beta domain